MKRVASGDGQSGIVGVEVVGHVVVILVARAIGVAIQASDKQPTIGAVFAWSAFHTTTP